MTYKCKYCGAGLEATSGGVKKCGSCARVQALPSTKNEDTVNLFNRATHLRSNLEFDKAREVYEKILKLDGKDPEAHFGIFLCTLGVIYTEDSATGKRIPIINRASEGSLLTDSSFISAIQLADGERAEIYKSDAAELERLNKSLIDIAREQKETNVFILCKDVDADGKHTPEHNTALKLHRELMLKGLRAFYAPISLKDVHEQDREGYVYAAQKSAKVILILGTKPTSFTDPLIRNEWERFLKMGAKRYIIPCYSGMDAYDLPEELSRFSPKDMSALGFIADIIEYALAMCEVGDVSSESKTTPSAPRAPKLVDETTDPATRRLFILIEDGDFEAANAACENILNKNPECADAYLGKLMIEYKLTDPKQLAECKETFFESTNYKNIMKFGSLTLKRVVQTYTSEAIYSVASEMYDKARALEEVFDLEGKSYNYEYEKLASKRKDAKALYGNAKKIFESISIVKDSAERAADCDARIENFEKNYNYNFARVLFEVGLKESGEKRVAFALSLLNEISPWRDSETLILSFKEEAYKKALAANRDDEDSCYHAIELLESVIPWKDADEKLDQFRNDRQYCSAISDAANTSHEYDGYSAAINKLIDISPWRDSDKKIDEYTKARQWRIATETKAHNKTIFSILGMWLPTLLIFALSLCALGLAYINLFWEEEIWAWNILWCISLGALLFLSLVLRQATSCASSVFVKSPFKPIPIFIASLIGTCVTMAFQVGCYFEAMVYSWDLDGLPVSEWYLNFQYDDYLRSITVNLIPTLILFGIIIFSFFAVIRKLDNSESLGEKLYYCASDSSAKKNALSVLQLVLAVVLSAVSLYLVYKGISLEESQYFAYLILIAISAAIMCFLSRKTGVRGRILTDSLLLTEWLGLLSTEAIMSYLNIELESTLWIVHLLKCIALTVPVAGIIFGIQYLLLQRRSRGNGYY